MDLSHQDILHEILTRVTRIEGSTGFLTMQLQDVQKKMNSLDVRVQNLERSEAAEQAMTISRTQSDQRRDAREQEMARDISLLINHRHWALGGFAVLSTVWLVTTVLAGLILNWIKTRVP